MAYQEHPSFNTPTDDTVIYRYMSFTKYAALLDKQALYFSSATDFEDGFEGSTGPAVAPNLQSLWMRRMKQFILISSWQQAEHESLAMWKIYLNSDEGIALKTTVGKLKEALQKSSRPVHVGTVSYVDYEKEKIPTDNIFAPYLYKQLSFAYEQECRAILNLMPDQSGNFPLTDDDNFAPVDINLLAEEIIISPFAAEWFGDLVKSVSKKFNLSQPVKKSYLKQNW